MSGYEPKRFTKKVEKFDFDYGPEIVEEEVSPADVLEPGYAVDHLEEFKRIEETFSDGDLLKAQIWETAQIWGAYMEEEIRRSPKHELTKEMVEQTQEILEEWNAYYDGWGCDCIPYILATTWENGQEFAKLYGLNQEQISFERAVTSDRAYSLGQKFKKEKNKTTELRAKYLVDVLETPENLQYFQKELKNKELKEIEFTGATVDEIIPAISFSPERTTKVEVLKILQVAQKIMAEKTISSKEKLEELQRKIKKRAKQEVSESSRQPVKSGENGNTDPKTSAAQVCMKRARNSKEK